ncbi:hypothetical protein BKA69DRAFT_1074686 [Paraphysoderma sedebokerense]|nr:hypothetical protein BKA69DRAFT_1074686 [Paraphysoderma sedebokerense]
MLIIIVTITVVFVLIVTIAVMFVIIMTMTMVFIIVMTMTMAFFFFVVIAITVIDFMFGVFLRSRGRSGVVGGSGGRARFGVSFFESFHCFVWSFVKETSRVC